MDAGAAGAASAFSSAKALTAKTTVNADANKQTRFFIVILLIEVC
jgi:hypothetical protein